MTATFKPAFVFVRLLALLSFGFAAVEADAAPLVLHRLFSSHMVLQRDAADPVWGWATPGATVTVKIFNQSSAPIQTNTAVAGLDGHWQMTVGPFGLVANNAAYSLTISDGTTTITLTDVLIGDVWLCSGQSNMEYSLNTIGVTNLSQEIADSINYTNVRNFFVPKMVSLTSQTNISSGSWVAANPSTVANMSATAYFTAREIYKQQGVPIGILVSAWNGTEISLWTDPDFANGFADFTQPIFDQSVQAFSSNDNSIITGGYNAMIAPLAPFRLKAVEWYQGEYNVSWPEQYIRLLPALMSKWRAIFGQPSLPFIIIQLPNINGLQTQPVETGSWAELREAQFKTVVNDTNARIVTTVDIGGGILHPIDKQDVGQRAAWAAANMVYGQNIVDQAPALAGFTISGTNIICTFTKVGAGLMVGTKTLSPLSPAQQVVGGTLGNFAICGANKIFFAAKAVITATNQLTVSSASVSIPVAVRYAWGSNPSCNLYNKITDGVGNVTNGLLAGSFRTDPVNLLTVNIGTGTGYYASNAVIAITASNLTAQTFHHWSGDTNLLSALNSSSVTATQAQEYVSVLANYQITAALSGVAAASQPGQIVVSWNPLVAVHYNVKRSTVTGGPYTTIASNLVNVSSYVDGNVTVGTPYYYVVSAINLLGEGPDSLQVSAIPAGGSAISTNTWDANGITSPNPADGSGNWLMASNWWNGSTNVTGHWTNSPSDSAIFGAGVAGAYTVNLGGNTVYASNVTFSTSGYTLTNGALTLLGAGTPITVNASVAATIKNALTISVGNPTFQVNAGGTLSLGGGGTMSGNVIFKGGGMVDLNSGNFSGGNFTYWEQTPVTQEAATLSVARMLIGYGGDCTYTMNSPGAQTSWSGGGGDSLIGRSGNTGTWDLKQGSATLTLAVGGNLRVGNDGSSKGTLTVEGGTFNLGNNGLYINAGATSSGGAGNFNLSGGTLTAGTVQFGDGVSTFSPGSTAALNMTGGTLYIGSGGIINGALGTLARTIMLSGGTIGAVSNWLSSLPMTLTNVNGAITFQAADSGSNAKDITLSGALSGIGGLIKTGSGTLTLGGANTFSGGTTINAGTLMITTTNNVSMAYTNNGGVLNLRRANAGSSLSASGLAFGSGSPQLTFNLAGFGASITPLLTNSGNLIMNGNVIVNASNAPASGTSILFSYSGTRSGAGNFVAGTIPVGATLIDDTVGQKVSIAYPPATTPMIAAVSYNASSISFSGTNGTPFITYRIMSSTKMVAPVWIPVLTNAFDASGNFNTSVSLNPETATIFYRLATP